MYDLAYIDLHNLVDDRRTVEVAVETDTDTYGPWTIELAPSESESEANGIPEHQAFIPPVWDRPAPEYEVRMRLTDGDFAQRDEWGRLSTATIDGSYFETTHFVAGGRITPMDPDLLAPTLRRVDSETADEESQWVTNKTNPDRFGE